MTEHSEAVFNEYAQRGEQRALLTEVLRRAEERRAEVAARIGQREQNIMTFGARIGELQAEIEREQDLLVRDKEELRHLGHLIEPLAGIESQNETEPAQWAAPEKHRTRRTLDELVLDVVRKNTGRRHEELTEILAKRRRGITSPDHIQKILLALDDAGKVEWRDGWYPASALPPANGEPEASGMSVLMDPDECEHGYIDACLECEQTAWPAAEDEMLAMLPGGLGAPQAGGAGEDTPGSKIAPGAPPPCAGEPSLEKTFAFIRGAYPDSLGDFQLRHGNHLGNLPELQKRGLVERLDDGRYRWVRVTVLDLGDETAEAAK